MSRQFCLQVYSCLPTFGVVAVVITTILMFTVISDSPSPLSPPPPLPPGYYLTGDMEHLTNRTVTTMEAARIILKVTNPYDLYVVGTSRVEMDTLFASKFLAPHSNKEERKTKWWIFEQHLNLSIKTKQANFTNGYGKSYNGKVGDDRGFFVFAYPVGFEPFNYGTLGYIKEVESFGYEVYHIIQENLNGRDPLWFYTASALTIGRYFSFQEHKSEEDLRNLLTEERLHPSPGCEEWRFATDTQNEDVCSRERYHRGYDIIGFLLSSSGFNINVLIDEYVSQRKNSTFETVFNSLFGRTLVAFEEEFILWKNSTLDSVVSDTVLLVYTITDR